MKQKIQPYHKFVFDLKNRKFLGKFEDMYKSEEKGNFDSWRQEDLTHLGKQISLLVLGKYNFKSILDIGCGKGAFTHLLKKANNRVSGIDISRAAIEKAKSRFSGIDFHNLGAQDALTLPKKWDLVVIMEVLSYLKNWKEVIKLSSKRSKFLYLSLYIPVNPIGFVKSFSDLTKEIKKYFNIETELLWNNEAIFVLAKNKHA